MDSIVLLSGGLDSATVLAIAQDRGDSVHALSFRYGQRHEIELEAAERIARQARVASHRVIDFDMRQIGGSALTADIDVPKDRDEAEMTASIPVTYVPARNTIFLSYALALAEVQGISKIYVGVNALDYSGYPDCRPEFIEAFEKLANLATKSPAEGGQDIVVEAPLIHMTKADIIKCGTDLGVDYGLTVSCYDPAPNGAACGHCDACLLRKKGFAEAGVADPTRYVEEP